MNIKALLLRSLLFGSLLVTLLYSASTFAPAALLWFQPLAAQPAGATPAVLAPNEPATLTPAQDEERWRLWQTLTPDEQAKVDPRILAELRGQLLPAHLGGTATPPELLPAPIPLERTRFLLYLREATDLTALRDLAFASQAEQRSAVFTTLMTTTRNQQAALRGLLANKLQAQAIAGYQPFYIVNAIAVDGNLETVIELAQRADVARLIANYPLLKADESTPAPPVADGTGDQGVTAAQLDPENWNISLVRADLVWNNLNVRGTGAVVAGFDTGVTFRHPALLRHYRGNLGNNRFDHNYNWFEPDGDLYEDGNLGPSLSDEPGDCDGHGTHTMGTAVGSGQGTGTDIGMAPDASWIAIPGICYGTMSGGIHDDIGGLKAFQWLLCPTDLSGDLTTADCSKAPDVVNNSWGSANPVNDILRPAIQALRAANIAPVFASGNPGAGAGSIGTPANAPEAITVGATNSSDEVASFSGRGPSFYEGEQKPELSAPGVGVLSSVGSSDYINASGTSMAAPHVTGLIALMVSADLRDGVRDFSVDELEQFMTYTAVDLGKSGPDDDYGYGRIDAFAAVSWVLTAGDLTGVVRDGTTGAPVMGATVRGIGNQTFTGTSGASGIYSVTVPAGGYNVVVEAWGYAPRTFTGQTVLAGALSLADFTLTPLPRVAVQGLVQSENGPVAGVTLAVAAQPTLTTTTGSDGRYTLSLPAGQHQLLIDQPGYRILQQAVTVDSAPVNQDLSLETAPSILLVEADAYRGWFSGWSIRNFFRWALVQQRYRYDLWRIENTSFNGTREQADGSIQSGIPSVATLQQYDLVIWVHIGCDSGYLGCYYRNSPSAIRADDELMAYMDGGGRLLISGQDLGFGEDGRLLFDNYLHADLALSNAAPQDTAITGAGFLENLTLTVTNASLYGYPNGAIQLSPDGVEAQSTGTTTVFPILYYASSNLPAGLAVDSCASNYRAVYFSVGFENIGPRAGNRNPAIAETLGRSIRWANDQRAATSIELHADEGVGFNRASQQIAHTLQIVNSGTQSAMVNVTTAGSLWPTQIFSGTTPLTQNIQLPPCETVELTVAVQVPANTPVGKRDAVTVTVQLVQEPQRAKQVTLISAAFDRWQTEPAMPTNRFAMGGVTSPTGPYLYTLGGWYNSLSDLDPVTKDRASAANERYNSCTERWERLTPMPSPRANSGVGSLNGEFYVVGGMTQSLIFGFPLTSYHAEVFVYNPATDQWREIAPLPTPLAAAAVAGGGGKLYAFGGSYYGSFSQRTYIYDPALDQWQEGAAPPGNGRYGAAAAFLGGEIYLVGGYPGLATVLIYNPTTNTWRNGPALANGRYAFGLTAAPDGYLYAVGGASNTTAVRTAERYSVAQAQWEAIPAPRSRSRDSAALAYSAGRIYTLGGDGAAINNEALAIAPSFCLSGLATHADTIGMGSPITYTVELQAPRNNLPAARFSHTLPLKTEFAGFIANPVGAQYNAAQRQVEWQGGLTGGSGPQQVIYRVNTNGATLQDNERLTSTIYFDNGIGTAFTRTQTTVALAVDLQQSAKSVSRAVALSSDIITYTIRLQGRGYLGSAVSMRDPLPATLAYLPGTLTYNAGNGRYDEATHSILWEGTTSSNAVTYRNSTDDYTWGDSDGSGEIKNVAYEWIDIATTGKSLGGGDIVYRCDLPIGFNFSFYDELMSTFCVSTNGFVSFDRNGLAEDSNICPLPSDFGTDAIIAALWDDLVVDGQIYYETLGSAPNRYLVVQWEKVRRYGSYPDIYSEFQMVLYENGIIRLGIRSAGSLNGSFSTTGLESPTGNSGVTYACNQEATLHDELGIVFVPPDGVLGEAMAEIQFQATGAADTTANVVVTNTALITTVSAVFERSAPILFNPVTLDTSTFTVEEGAVAPGGKAHYQLLLTNTGLMTAANASLVVNLPTALQYEAGSLLCSSGTCSGEANQLTWTGALGPGQPYTITFSAKLTVGVPDRTPLLATVTLSDGYGKSYPFNATLLAQRSDLSRSALELSPPYGEPGQHRQITVLVRNQGALATNGEATITLPTALTYQPDSLVCGTGTCTYRDGSIQWQGALAARAIVPIRFDVEIPATASYGDSFTFTATLRDAEWSESLTLSGTLRVAHLLYLPVVRGPLLGNRLFLPLVGQE